jgi:hypothetical protein
VFLIFKNKSMYVTNFVLLTDPIERMGVIALVLFGDFQNSILASKVVVITAQNLKN